jgi:YD repeat-containing protein
MVKKILCVLGIVFFIFPLASYADTAPPIIGPWSYSAVRCDHWLGPWSSETEAAQTGAKTIYGPTAVLDGSTGWGGAISCRGYYDSNVNKMGIEDRSYTVYYVKYGPTLNYRDGLLIRRERSVTCPAGTINTEYACVIKNIVAYLPKENPPPSCPSNPVSGNPVVIANGSKFEVTDPINNGSLTFSFIYNNSNPLASTPWTHSFQNSIQIVDPSTGSYVKAKSKAYSSRAEACVAGWSEIKVNLTDTWSQGATARLNGLSCEIVNSGKVVNHLFFFIPELLVPGSIQLFRDDGSIVSYEYNGGDSFRSVSGAHGQLQKASNGEWQYSLPSGVVERYDQTGKLIEVIKSGKKHTLTYNSVTGILEKVVDIVGNSLVFSYANNQLTGVTQENNKTTQYIYNANGILEKIIHPNSTFRQFHYEDIRFPAFLTGITDERGVKYASWAYDAQGRAISSEHANGADKVTFAFNADGSATVTNPLNKQTIYRFDDIAGARRVVKVEGQPTTNCAGANQNYTYTPEGWVASKTDWNGNKTAYIYNTKGQETSRTEAVGAAVAKTIATEWHTTLNLRTKVTEPNKETTYSYDANGLLLNQKTRSLVAQ